MSNNKLINRAIEPAIGKSLNYFPVVTITGPRQSGKTTLCRKMFGHLPYVNLEDVSTLQRAKDDVKAFLATFPDGGVIDEAQNLPELFSVLQVEVDEDSFQGRERKFVITGSNNFSLMSRLTQSMAGRTALFRLLPFSLDELGKENSSLPTDTLLLRGGYPAIWKTPDLRGIILESYYSTYVERDARQVLNLKDALPFFRFIRLCASRIGTEFKASALSNEVGVSLPTINSWLSVLAASYIIYLLPPYSANIKKRIVKTPKIYFYDTALAAYLLGIDSEQTLAVHPLRGALFENMVVNEMMKSDLNKGREPQLYFYRDHSQREVDLLRVDGLAVHLYEIKSGMTFNADFFKNLRYLQALMPKEIASTQVIYDGVEQRDTTFDGIRNFRSL